MTKRMIAEAYKTNFSNPNYRQIGIAELEADYSDYPLDLFDRIKMLNHNILVRDLAVMASIGSHQIGERKLYEKLRSWRMIKANSTEPYQKYLDQHIFEIRTGLHMTRIGPRFHHTTEVTPKGQAFIIDCLRKEGFYLN